MLDGRGGLDAMPLPSGRQALIQRLEALTGSTGAPAGIEPVADPLEPLVRELRRHLGDRLLRLEAHTGRDGREILLAVTDGAIERSRIEELLQRRFAGDSPPPVLELLDRSTFETLERLAEAGILQVPREGRRLLHPSTLVDPQEDVERERRLAAARETLTQAERKIRMAAVLASGGFAIEALPALREGVELGLRARAQGDGLGLAETEPVPLAWIESHLPGHLSLLKKLRDETEALLGATGEEVRAWITAGEGLVGEIAGGLR